MVRNDATAGSDNFSPEWFAHAVQDFSPAEVDQFRQAVDWASNRLQGLKSVSGEPCIAHAAGVVSLLAALQLDVTSMIAALAAAAPNTSATSASQKAFKQEVISQFGLEVFNLVKGSQTLVRVGAATTYAGLHSAEQKSVQQEMQRKMLLAMAADLRIVIIRLLSRLQSLRWYSQSKTPCPPEIAQQTRIVYAPLANRLGIWQIKWELEDLAFRFTDPETYHDIAAKLESKRTEREAIIASLVAELKALMSMLHIQGDVAGRAKHIFSIYNKMCNKHLRFDQVHDLNAIRVIVQDERECYAVLAAVHSHWTPVIDEFDDYIAHPKPNGYRSLHTVVCDDEGRSFELQIRTRQMHQFSEFGMAAHWRYKESGAQGGKTRASSLYDRQISWLRQLLSWKKEVGLEGAEQSGASAPDGAQPDPAAQPPGHDKVYALTPQAKVLELPSGSTPLDFAYYLHTDLGHRCRGARVDGQMQALNTPLRTGQTVEIISAKSGAPSRDWLNPQLGYLASPRARAKVRLWFNAIELQQRINTGHELVDKELQKLGKTAVSQDKLAEMLGFARPDDLYVAVAKDEFSLRSIGKAFETADTKAPESESSHYPLSSRVSSKGAHAGSGVLVVGVDSLLTQLAKCCRPAPPDEIAGFVTRGRGVSVHRRSCSNFKSMALKHPERVIEVSWGDHGDATYQVNLSVVAQDNKDLYRDILESFSKLKVNLAGMNTLRRENAVYMQFMIDIQDGQQLSRALASLRNIPGVMSAQRL